MTFSAYSDIPWFKNYMAMSLSPLRKRLIREGIIPRACSRCGITEWQGEPAPLQLDHIDGNRLNNMLANLRLLCPNCHALTPTYGGRKRGVSISVDDMILAYDKYVEDNGTPPSANRLYILLGRPAGVGGGEAARWVQSKIGADRPLAKRVKTPPGVRKTKIEWPSDEDLRILLETKSRVQLGKMLGVSDNAIKKHCEIRGIVTPTKRRVYRPKPVKKTSSAEKTSAFKASGTRGSKPKPIVHGTFGGYHAEIRRGLPTCDACKAANAEYNRNVRNGLV